MFNCRSRYDPLLQTTNLASMLCRAAVHSAWMVYILPPSPVNPMTVRSGCATLTPIAPGIPTPSDPPRVRKILARGRWWTVAHHRRRAGQRFVKNDGVLGKLFGQFLHESRHLERRGIAFGLVLFELGLSLLLFRLAALSHTLFRGVLLLGRQPRSSAALSTRRVASDHPSAADRRDDSWRSRKR